MKSQASSRNALKRRSKRQFNPSDSDNTNTGCHSPSTNYCSRFRNGITRYGALLHYAQNNVASHRLYTNGLTNIGAFQNGGMCHMRSSLLTANAFSALAIGHITILQLSSLKLFPVKSITVDELLNAGYITTYNEVNLLTALGFLATSFGHISVSQLTDLNLYPLQAGTITADLLIQAKYLTADCYPTALGLAAIRIHYIQTTDFSEFGCQANDYSQVSLAQLTAARYIYGQFNILTPIGISALQAKYLPEKVFQQVNVYPFGLHSQGQWVGDGSEDGNQLSNDQIVLLIHDLVQVGYLHANTNLLTNAGYHAIQTGYFSIELYRSLKLWPCPVSSASHNFLSAGYITYTGHLTELGASLLHDQYYSPEWLLRLGVHSQREYHGFHSAFVYAGHLLSQYNSIHMALHNGAFLNAAEKASVRISFGK